MRVRTGVFRLCFWYLCRPSLLTWQVLQSTFSNLNENLLRESYRKLFSVDLGGKPFYKGRINIEIITNILTCTEGNGNSSPSPSCTSSSFLYLSPYLLMGTFHITDLLLIPPTLYVVVSGCSHLSHHPSLYWTYLICLPLKSTFFSKERDLPPTPPTLPFPWSPSYRLPRSRKMDQDPPGLTRPIPIPVTSLSGSRNAKWLTPSLTSQSVLDPDGIEYWHKVENGQHRGLQLLNEGILESKE